ncbi:MAG: aminotransferase class I/II-fold pyridoxal phosphate-dependent enzyme [Bacteroidales bacterium]
MSKRIYLSPPNMSGQEIQYIQEAFETNWVAPSGENVDEFEKAIEEYLGIGHAVALSSGTAALHLALINLGIEASDEVLVPTLTFCASVNPIVYQSATPVFVDSERSTWNMDPQLLETAIKDRLKKGKKPKAIILVHLYGMPADVNKIKKIANDYEIPVIEDAAEALGSSYKNKPVGTFGDIGVLSFNGNKIITTSGGGALVTEVAEYAERTLFLSTQARDNVAHYQHSEIGYNYRMSNIIAGIGRGQMNVLKQRIKQKRENFIFYRKEMAKYHFIEFLTESEEAFSNYWLTTILIHNEKITPSILQEKMEENNIEVRPIWKPMHMQPVFAEYPAYLNGTAEFLFRNGICLPSGSHLSNEDRERISNAIHKIFDKTGKS